MAPPGSASENLIDSVLAELDRDRAPRVRLGGFDVDGVLRGKYVTRKKFESVVRGTMGFCDVIFGWDVADALYEDVGVTLTGWEGGYGDLVARIDPSSRRSVPWDRGHPFFLLDFELPDGSPYPASPRQLLKTVLGKAEAMGFDATFAAEFEFFLFDETSASVRDKGYAGLQPLSPGMFGYSALRASTYGEQIHELVDLLDAFDVEVEGIHTETGPGVYEAALAYGPALKAADDAALFKTAVKEILVRHGIMATFMAKISPDLPGCSGHTHMSLWRDGQPVFHDPSSEDGLSQTFKHFLGGLQRLLPDLMVLFCPTVNSYKRTVPGMWAPTTATWGVENRTAALRVIKSASGKGTRVENRLVGSDMQPHLAFAASLAAGLYGIKHRIEPGPILTGNAYSADAKAAPPLPRTLSEATDNLAGSDAAREMLGDAFVDHYVATRRWEELEYRKAVTNWELDRYFEII